MVRATAGVTATAATTGAPVTSSTSRAVRLRPGSARSTIPSSGRRRRSRRCAARRSRGRGARRGARCPRRRPATGSPASKMRTSGPGDGVATRVRRSVTAISSSTGSGMPSRAAVAGRSPATSSVRAWPAAYRARAAATVLVPWPPRAPLRITLRVRMRSPVEVVAQTGAAWTIGGFVTRPELPRPGRVTRCVRSAERGDRGPGALGRQGGDVVLVTLGEVAGQPAELPADRGGTAVRTA